LERKGIRTDENMTGGIVNKGVSMADTKRRVNSRSVPRDDYDQNRDTKKEQWFCGERVIPWNQGNNRIE